MPHAEVDPEHPQDVLIGTGYQDRYLIKQLPGARWDTERRIWRAPVSWATAMILRGLFKDQLTLGDEFKAWGWRERRDRVEDANRLRERLELADDDDSPAAKVIRGWRDLPDSPRLHAFQEAGVRYLYAAVNAGLLDEMGTGKTIQGICLLRLLHELGEGPFPALVVAPNSVKTSWAKEFKAWWPEARVQLVHGGAGARREQLKTSADVYIINWEALRLHSRLAAYGSYALSEAEKTPKELNEIPWRTVIADEAHRAKDPRAKQTRALWAVSRPAARRVFMTGTPIANRPDELWSPLHFMDPREWPSKTRFVDYFTNKTFNFWGGMEILGLHAETRSQFFSILDPRTRRMPKTVVLPQLPEKVYTTRWAEMLPKQRKAYQQMLKEMLAELDDEDAVAAPNPLTRALRLMQFASAYAVSSGDGSILLDEPSNKLDVLDELIEETEGEQLVVFAQSRQLINLAAARAEKNKIPFGLITGDISVPDRQSVVDDFQDGRLRMVLATTGAGGTGITLTASKTLIRLQRDWSIVNNTQAEDRVHRIGSEVHDSVNIIDIVAPDTIEVRQLEALAGKGANLQEIVRDKEALRRLLKGE